MRSGTRIGVDVGSVRVGVAASDGDGLIATPVATLARDLGGGTDLRQLAHLVVEREVVELVVGLPRSLSGAEGAAAAAARGYAERLAELVDPVPVRLVDERLSTVTAQQQLRRAGVRERQGRAVVDQAAAVVILQHALDSERSTGRAPGDLVRPPG